MKQIRDVRHCDYGIGLKKYVVASVFDQGTKNIMTPVRDAQRYNNSISNMFHQSNWIQWPSYSFEKILLTLKNQSVE